MMIALKITADRIADSGEARPMTLSGWICGYTPMNIAGRISRSTSRRRSRSRNVVSEAARQMRSCLPTSTTSSSFVDPSRGRPCCRPLWPPACRYSSPRRRRPARVPARRSCRQPVIATSLPLACSSLMRFILVSGVASARKSSTPALARDRLRGARVVAGDHHRANAHRAKPAEPLRDALLDDVLQVDDAEHAVAIADRERRAARYRRSCSRSHRHRRRACRRVP